MGLMMNAIIADTLSRSVQDYLKTIYTLTRNDEPIGTVELADAMKVSPASVSNMLQKLDSHEPRLVDYHKHRGALLTDEGEKAALKMIRRHRLLEQFLCEILGYSWEMVHKEAEELEHVISPYMEDRIAELLGDPRYDPHGEPIPNRALEMLDNPRMVALSELEAGESGRVCQLDSHKEYLFGYFKEIGLRMGALVRVVQRNPIDGTQRVLLDDLPQEYVIGPGIAGAVLVSLD
jgi:DtxR family Mn-dependent transcriptional regulator